MRSRPIDHAAVCEELLEHGYAVIRPFASDVLPARIDAEIERLLGSDSRPSEPTHFSGFSTIRYFDLLNEGEVWQRAATQRDVLNIAAGVLGHDNLLSLMCTALVCPGETAQMIHADDDVYGLPRPHQPLVLNTIWAMSDFTEETGATRVIRGSHRRRRAPRGDEHAQTIPLEMPRGSIGLILGTTYHGAGANQSTKRRDAVIINYCAGMMRQHENLWLSLRPEKIATFPKALRILLGCEPAVHGPGLVSERARAALARSSKAGRARRRRQE